MIRRIAATAVALLALAAPALAQVQPSAPIASKSYVDTALGQRLPLSGGAMTGAITCAGGSTCDISGLSAIPSTGAAAGTLARLLADRAQVASPTFTGTVTAPVLALTGSGSTGAVDGMSVGTRTLATRFGEVINAADYGVSCNNTDVTTALTAAVAAAVPKALYIPPQPGKCLVSGGIPHKAGLTLFAQRGTVTIAPTAGNTGGLFGGNFASKLTISGLTFDGGGASFASAAPAITLYRSDGVRIVDSDFTAIRGQAILCSNCSNVEIIRSTFSDIGNYWRTSGAAADRRAAISFCCADAGSMINRNNAVRDSLFTDIGLDAISSGNGLDFLATGNRCYWPSYQFATLGASAYGACIYVANSDGAVLTSNSSYGASGNGFDTANVTRATITANLAALSGQAGINYNGSIGTITGNILTNNVKWSGSPQKGGISIFAGVNTSLTGNIATDTQTTKTQLYGIWGDSSSSRTGAFIHQSNILNGNATGALGGGITAYGAQ